MSTVASTPDLPSDPDELKAAIDARRVHLATTVDELTDRLAPSALADEAKQQATAKVRETFTDSAGNLRSERVAALSAAVIALLALVVTGKVRGRRKKAERRARRETCVCV